MMWRGIVRCFLSESDGNVNCVIVEQEELGEGLAIKLVFLRKSGVSRLETKKKCKVMPRPFVFLAKEYKKEEKCSHG